MARLTIQEAAKLTGVSARTIRRRVKDGSLHAEKVLRDGREVWMIDPGSLAAWADTQGRDLRWSPSPRNRRPSWRRLRRT